MTSDRLRSVVLAASCAAFVAVPNIGALVGRGERTDRYDTVITPPPYAFAVWAPIFTACAADTVAQCTTAGRERASSRRTGWPLAAAYVANTAWSLAAQTDRFRYTPLLLLTATASAALAPPAPPAWPTEPVDDSRHRHAPGLDGTGEHRQPRRGGRTTRRTPTEPGDTHSGGTRFGRRGHGACRHRCQHPQRPPRRGGHGGVGPAHHQRRPPTPTHDPRGGRRRRPRPGRPRPPKGTSTLRRGPGRSPRRHRARSCMVNGPTHTKARSPTTIRASSRPARVRVCTPGTHGQRHETGGVDSTPTPIRRRVPGRPAQALVVTTRRPTWPAQPRPELSPLSIGGFRRRQPRRRRPGRRPSS